MQISHDALQVAVQPPLGIDYVCFSVTVRPNAIKPGLKDYLLPFIGLIRGHEEAERLFVASDGFSHLLRALQRNIPKLNVKTIFLISNLTEEKREYLGKVTNMFFPV